MYDSELDINGVVVPNPNYNSKTTVGRQQPKTIKVFGADGSAYNKSKNLENLANYNINQLNRRNNPLEGIDVGKFNEYGVEVGINSNISYLEQERAKNQSGFEQLGRSIGQIAINEVFLGTLLGFSDLYDWFANLGKDIGEDDWNNAFGQALTQAQDKVREDLAIYRANPDKSFDVTDSGWWWDNFVNVGSTVSLLLPAMGVTAALGKVGKLTKAAINGTKFDRGLYKADRWLSKLANKAGIEHPYTIKSALTKFKDAAVPSVISRQMEDSLEGRETYKQVYKETIDQLSSMNEQERNDFNRRNKDVVYNTDGTLKSDDEIAKYIADKAATYTFVNDFKYIGFDFLQFNNILRFGSKPLTRATYKTQRDVLRQMAVGTEKAAEELVETASRSELLKDAITFYAKNPRIALANLAAKSEFTEGLEEMGQGITQNNAKAEYEKFFNPQFTNRTLMSQLSDPQLWEQGFWGMAGGIVFQSAGKGLNKLGKYIYKKTNNKNLTDVDIKKLEATEESIRQDDINSRLTAARTLEAKLALWKQGYNPQQKRYNENGKPIALDYTDESQFSKMTEEQKDIILDEIINEYMTDMVTSAVDVGNGDLLESFIKSEEFDTYISRISNDNKDIKNLKDKMLKRFDTIKESYYKNLETVFGSVNVESEYIGKAIAANMTRNSIKIADLETEIKRLEDSILENTDTQHYNNYIEKRRIGVVNKYIGGLINEQKELEKELKNKKVNKTFVNSRLNEINSILKELYKIGDISKQYEQAYKELVFDVTGDEIKDSIKQNDDISKAFAELSKSRIKELENEEKEIGKIPEVVKTLANRQVEAEAKLAAAKAFEIKSQEELQDVYNDFIAAHTEIINNRFNNARKRILEYIENSDKPLEAYNSLFDGTAPKSIQEDFDMFKIGNDLYAQHAATFRLAANIQEKKKEMRAKATPEETKNKEPENKKDKPKEPTKQSSLSTGVQTQENNEQQEETPTTLENTFEEESFNDIINDEVYSEEEIEKQGFINIIIPKKLKETDSIVKTGIRENGIEGEEFKDFIESCVTELKSNTLFENMSNEDLTRTIEQEFANFLESRLNYVPINIQKDYEKLISEIKNKKYAADTKLITNDDIMNEVEKQIDKYIKENGKEGTYIDLEDLFKYLVDNCKGLLVNLLTPTVYKISKDINSEKPKYKIDKNSSYLLAQYKENPARFLQHLISIKTERTISDEATMEDFHTIMPDDAYDGLRYKIAYEKGDMKTCQRILGKRVITVEDDGLGGTIEKDSQKERFEKITNAYNTWVDSINLLNNPNAQLIICKFGDTYQVRVYDNSINIEDLKNNEYKNRQIAYWSRVQPIEINGKNKNTAFTRVYNKDSIGLFFKIYEDENGNLISNFDKLNKDLGLNTNKDSVGYKIFNMLLNKQTDFTKEELELIHDYFKEYLNTKENETHPEIILENKYNGKSLNEEQVNELFYKRLYNIFAYSYIKNVKKTQEESFYDYKQKTYDNYRKTYELDKIYDENYKQGKYCTIKIKQIPNTFTEMSSSNEEKRINNKEFDPNVNKLVYIDNDYKIHISGENTSYQNNIGTFINSVGILLEPIKENSGFPKIAFSVNQTKLENTNPLYNPLRETLKYLIKQCYIENKKSGAIKKLNDDIKELIGKDSIFYAKSEDKTKSFIKEFNDKIYTQKEYSDNLVDYILSKITFNTSVSLAKGELTSSNKFISFDNGKLIISLPNENGTINFEYASYTDFCIKNETFTINQKLTDSDRIPKTILLDSHIGEFVEEGSPVEGGDILNQINTAKITLNKLKANEEFESKKLLSIIGFTDDEINTLFGDSSNISFINPMFIYDKHTKTEEFGYYRPSTKKVYLTNNLFKEENIPNDIANFRYNIARVLIHENIHKNFDELSEDDKKLVVNHLKELFVDFANYLIEDSQKSDIDEYAKNIINSFKNTRWSLDNIKSLKETIENNTIKEKDIFESMNEFLAETLSQSYLIKYLDSKEYRGKQIETEEKTEAKESIWTKIVNLIVKFFNKVQNNFLENLSINNLDNSEKISIFAEEYKLLSVLGGDKIITKKESNVVKQDNIEFDGQLTIDFNENQNNENQKEITDDEITEDMLSQFDAEKKDLEDMKNNITNDKLSAETKLITPFEVASKIKDDNGNFDNSGLRRVQSINDFTRSYNYNEQAIISSLIDSAAFEYACG